MAKYFASSQESLVADAIAGFSTVHSGLVAHHAQDGYVRARHTAPARRVGLLSGGGSGHEPMHVGFVGAGMLDAACPGQVFASPHNRQIFKASCAVAGPEGVLHIVKNYTGDRINFGIAAERLAHQGIPCARVLVDDDLASDSDGVAVGRRGTAATVLVEKILGAAADRGDGLTQLAELGARLVRQCRSMAVAAAAHTAPGTGRAAYALPTGMIEFGVGIHGERAARSLPQGSLAGLVGRMAEALTAALRPPPGAPVIVLVNGLGAVTSLELYAVAHETVRALEGRGVLVARSLVGDFSTALDTRGFSLTLLVADEEVLGLYDAPVRTPALEWSRPMVRESVA
ncbi:dihydroxyacetone kinase subunit DhaK [Streptacidiphilus sp. PB12-B1b]|uniref:dihydroxyacetone kinase subunit DhaK n=1 Tax=Streptacidiphilus sp. PB12-B1b TaxID=2705012 RepID=UPI0015FA562C|nr:dihydroxyacetone kinase subunit DhaK [Streptacidiphilus sp. PB12-B1b]QMU76748.1 dihydroxyacetone kinase subunit DhaK [Streptacidiphilus sp. PB12-B1b]